MKRDFTLEECFEILEKYDKPLCEWYRRNDTFFGINIRTYAAYLYSTHLNEEGDRNNE